LSAILIKIFVFAYTWGFGGLLKREDNAEDDNIINQKSHVKSNLDNLTQEFDEFMREMFESNLKFGIYLPPNTNKDGSMDLRKLINKKKLGLYKD